MEVEIYLNKEGRKHMSWLDDELNKIDQQERERHRQEEIRIKKEEQTYNLLRQNQLQREQIARQRFTSISNSLQLPQLISEAQKHWPGSSFGDRFGEEQLGELWQSCIGADPCNMYIVYYWDLYKTHTTMSTNERSGRTYSHSWTDEIKISLWELISKRDRDCHWEDVNIPHHIIKFDTIMEVTPYNHDQIIALLKQFLAVAISHRRK